MSGDHGANQNQDQRQSGDERESSRNTVIDVDALGVASTHGSGRSRRLAGRPVPPEAPAACPVLFAGQASLRGRSGASRSLLLLLELILPRLEVVGKRLAVLLIAVGHALVSLLCSIGRLRLGRPGSALGGCGRSERVPASVTAPRRTSSAAV
jgi:hypothetical protein